MPDPRDRWSDNVGGEAVVDGRRVAFYVDRSCIVCRVCSDAAPGHFALSDEGDHDVCTRQPQTRAELARCDEAMANCPVEAIGDDG